jgi:hypothetical protein
LAKTVKSTKGKGKPRTKARKSFIRKVAGSRPRASKKRGLVRRVVWGTAKGTGRLIGKGTMAGAHATASRIERFRTGRKFADGYTPEPGEVPKGKWVSGATTVYGRKFDSPEAATAYADKVDKQDGPVVRADRPRGSLETIASGRRAGKVRVRPPRERRAPTGRHRKAAHRTRADQLVAAYRPKLNQIGRNAVDKDSEIARKIHRAFTELLEGRPGKLSDMEALALGMEQAMAVGAEAVQQYRLKMIKMGFDPAYLVFLGKVQENYQESANNWTSYIVVLKTELALEILEAQRRKAQQGQQRPSDDVLAG